MNKCAPFVLAVLATSGVAFAQFKTRPNTTLTAPGIPVNTFGNPAWVVAAPKQPVAGNAAAGTVHTRRLMHLVHLDVDANGNPFYAYRKSTDGGFRWSAVQTLYAIQPGEAAASATMRLLAYKNLVYFVFSSSRNNPSSNRSIFALASDDQGQSWQGPLLLSTGVNGAVNPLVDCENPDAAVALDVLHVAFEADSTIGPAEDVYYTSAGFVGGTFSIITAETRINTANAQGTVDCDFPTISADGQVVNVAWVDNRVDTTTDDANNTYSKTSSIGGTNFGTVPEINHSGFTGAIAGTVRQTQSAVAGNNVYVLMRDQRVVNAVDDVYLSMSNDAGNTWAATQINPAGPDTDQSALAASGNRIFVAFTDNRSGANDVYVAVDRNAGQEFLSGTHTETQLNNVDTPVLDNFDISGDVVALAYQECTPQDVAVGYSVDFGASWVSKRFTNGGGCARANRDVDDPSLAITQNRDIAVVWASEAANGTNILNKVFVSGTNLPVLQNLTGQNLGLGLVEASPRDTGDLALVLLSVTGTSFSILDAPSGFGMNLTFDGLTLGVLGNLAPFLTSISPGGTASFPTIPDIGALLGVNVWAAALTYDLTTAQFIVQTDPFKF